MCPNPKISTPSPHEARQPPSHCSGKEIQAGRQASPKATSRLHLCQLGPPLPGSLRGRGRGQRGGARSCRHPPGPVGTRGGMFLPLPGPPSACRPAHPGMAECKAGAGAGEGGALSLRRQQKTPTSMPTGPVSFCGSKRDLARASLEHSTHPRTWGTHLEVVLWAAPHPLPGLTSD